VSGIPDLASSISKAFGMEKYKRRILPSLVSHETVEGFERAGV